MESFFIAGIAVKTSNQTGAAAQDIPALWNRFYMEDIASKIPGKLDNDVYSVYTAYEGDYTQPYTTVIGCKVVQGTEIPEGLELIKIEGGDFLKQTVKGNLQQGIVFNAWVEIWNSDIKRAYTADFEVYGAGTKDPENAELAIYISTL